MPRTATDAGLLCALEEAAGFLVSEDVLAAVVFLVSFELLGGLVSLEGGRFPTEGRAADDLDAIFLWAIASSHSVRTQARLWTAAPPVVSRRIARADSNFAPR